MSLTRVQHITVRLAGQVEDLFHDVSFEINLHDRVGLIGPNGCGKTTLLRVLMEDLQPVSGNVIRSSTAEATGYLRQRTAPDSEWTVLQAALAGMPQLAALKETITHLEGRMPILTGEDLNQTVSLYGDALDAYHRAGGYEIEREATEALIGLGFTDDELAMPVMHLSSGQRTRVELARLLIQPTDLLLLDEPTNHLDIDGQDWLGNYVRRFSGAVLIVSHDRHFLDQTVSRILELRRGRLRAYAGDYTAYAAQRQQEEDAAWEQYDRAGKEAKRLRTALAERKRTARKVQGKPSSQTYDPYQKGFYQSKAARVEKRAKVIERRVEQQIEQQQAAKPFVEKRTILSFPPVAETGSVVFNAVGVSKHYGARVLFDDVAFSVTRGQRVVVIGHNGSGKTTLLKILLRQIAPDQGKIRIGSRVQIGYYDQEQEGLDSGRTILEEVLSAGGTDETWARIVLGALLLRRDKVHDQINTLSTGEQGRVALAKLLLSGANVLVLDEPTNHLDIDAREAVEGALSDYPGTILFVSHDRRLIERLADVVIEIADRRVWYYPGRYEAYVETRNR